MKKEKNMDTYVFEFEGEGIECVYDNGKWVACIKNWKPNNDIESIERLEVHHESDEQFILVKGKAILLLAESKDSFDDTKLIPMEIGKIYNVPKENWFNTITEKNTKLMYVQDAGTTDKNSEYCYFTEEQKNRIYKEAKNLWK